MMEMTTAARDVAGVAVMLMKLVKEGLMMMAMKRIMMTTAAVAVSHATRSTGNKAKATLDQTNFVADLVRERLATQKGTCASDWRYHNLIVAEMALRVSLFYHNDV